MLVFIDAPKIVKIFRKEEAKADLPRTSLGFMVKSNSEIRLGAEVKISRDEQGELDGLVETYRQAGLAQERANILGFPAIARSVAEYYGEGASPLEKKLISVALRESLRAIRRADREAHPGSGES